MTSIGKINKLKVAGQAEDGFYLDGGRLGEILLPSRQAPKDCKSGDKIEAFVYRDSGDQLIATVKEPRAVVGDFAFLKVVSVNAIGAFLDWGLPKDLLVPFREQKERMRAGKSYLVFVYLDQKSERIVASSKLNKFLNKEPMTYRVWQDVDLIIAGPTQLGYNAIINGKHSGLLYKNDIYQPLSAGQKLKGFIKKLRQDGKIDVTLHKPGYGKVRDLSEVILSELRKHNGFIGITDKTPAQEIYDMFGVSKKTYKKAVGGLFKRRLVTIEASGIRLVEKLSEV